MTEKPGEAMTEWTRISEALTAMGGFQVTADDLRRLAAAWPCPNPRHRRETTTRTGWTVKWTACPHCATRTGGRR